MSTFSRLIFFFHSNFFFFCIIFRIRLWTICGPERRRYIIYDMNDNNNLLWTRRIYQTSMSSPIFLKFFVSAFFRAHSFWILFLLLPSTRSMFHYFYSITIFFSNIKYFISIGLNWLLLHWFDACYCDMWHIVCARWLRWRKKWPVNFRWVLIFSGESKATTSTQHWGKNSF